MTTQTNDLQGTTIPGAMFRGRCECGTTFSFREPSIDAAEIVAQHAEHARQARRGRGRAQSEHRLTIETLSQATLRAEKIDEARRWVERSQQRLVEHRAAVAESLRRVASGLTRASEEIVRDVARLEASQETTTAQSVERAQHTVLWAVANLGLDNLTGMVAEEQSLKTRIADALGELAALETQG